MRLAATNRDNDACVYVETITPDRAAFYLEKNSRNRKLRPYHAATIARDMRMGRFVFNGDPIRVSEDDELLDGQHRLKAVIMSGVSLPFVIVNGIDRDAMMTIDGGLKRTHGDRLQISGVKNAKQVSGAISIMAILAAGSFRAKLTAAETFAAHDMHPDIDDAVSHVRGVGLGLDCILSAFYYIANYTGYAREADEFLSVFKTGVARHPNDPALAARERIIKARGGIARMHRDGLIAIICTAWEAKRGGRGLTRINVGSNSVSPYIFGWSEKDMPNCDG